MSRLIRIDGDVARRLHELRHTPPLGPGRPSSSDETWNDVVRRALGLPAVQR